MTTVPVAAGMPASREPSIVARMGVSVARFVRRKPLGAIGAAMVILVIGAAIVGPSLAKDPLEFDVEHRFTSPSTSAPFGTDDKGRDVLARTLNGAEISLKVGFGAALFGVTFGLVFGLVTGYLGGWVDAIGQRVVDSFLAFPFLLLGMAMTVALGRSVTNISIALAILAWPTAARVVRASVLALADAPYVQSARTVGASTPRILLRHLLPNLMSIYIVLATATIAQAVLTEAALSFLGVGVPPPQPSLGGMVFDAQQWAVRAPWIAIFPGMAITAIVFGVNLFGDALRDVLDPRLRRR